MNANWLPLLQFQEAFQTLYDERKRREYEVATFGTSRDGPREKIQNLEEENAAGAKEVDFNESFSREFARGFGREEVGEKRMAESLKKMNESLDEIEDGCGKLHESLGRVEETIKNNIEPVIEGIFAKSAAASCGSGKFPLVSEVTPRAEQEDWSEESLYEEDERQIVEMNRLAEEEECSGTDESLTERDVSAAELHRTVRESAPSPEPWPPQRGYLIVRTMPLCSIRRWD